MPALAQDFRVIAPDLPGHAFTRLSSVHTSLPAMAQALWSLMDTLDEVPTMIVGHSAGAAIALQMTNMRGQAIPIVVSTLHSLRSRVLARSCSR